MKQVDRTKLPQGDTFAAIIETYEHVAVLYGQASTAARDRNATKLAQMLAEIDSYKAARASQTKSMVAP